MAIFNKWQSGLKRHKEGTNRGEKQPKPMNVGNAAAKDILAETADRRNIKTEDPSDSLKGEQATWKKKKGRKKGTRQAKSK